MSKIVLLDPKLTPPPCKFQQFLSGGKFLRRLDEKRATVTTLITNIAKICSEPVFTLFGPRGGGSLGTLQKFSSIPLRAFEVTLSNFVNFPKI